MRAYALHSILEALLDGQALSDEAHDKSEKAFRNHFHAEPENVFNVSAYFYQVVLWHA